MKYIIIPILKIIWALMLTIIATTYIIAIILFSLWNLKIDINWKLHLNIKEILEYDHYDGLVNISPYFYNESKKGICTFKTFYHFIFKHTIIWKR